MTFVQRADDLGFGDVLVDGRMVKEAAPGLTENWVTVHLMDGSTETWEGYTQIELKITREQVGRDAGLLLQHMLRTADEADARQPHTIVVRDPETGKFDTHGPFKDRLTARIAQIALRERHRKDELDDLEYNLALHYDSTWPN